MVPKNQRKLIIVEDSDCIREAIAFALQKSGFDVRSAANGLEAIAILNGEKFDMVLTDYYMPGMNGLELIRWMRENEQYKRLPVVVLTTENQRDIILQAKNAGATGWIHKPFEIEKLTQTIRRIIR
ncbi:MAG: response regulator [Prolixibacteraceae bacterium]